MATAALRDALMAQIPAEQEHWRRLVHEVGPERMEEPGPMGEWTFRDLTGHLLGWRNRTIDRLEAAGRGEADPPPPWPPELVDDDAINAWIRARDVGRTTGEILVDYDASFDRLAAAVSGLPDDPARLPEPFASMTHAPDASAFFGHLHEEHEPDVRAWLSVTGPGGR